MKGKLLLVSFLAPKVVLRYAPLVRSLIPSLHADHKGSREGAILEAKGATQRMISLLIDDVWTPRIDFPLDFVASGGTHSAPNESSQDRGAQSTITEHARLSISETLPSRTTARPRTSFRPPEAEARVQYGSKLRSHSLR